MYRLNLLFLRAADADTGFVDFVLHQHLDLVDARQAFLADVLLDDPLVVLEVGAGAHGQCPGSGGVDEIGTRFSVALEQQLHQRAPFEAAVEHQPVFVLFNVDLMPGVDDQGIVTVRPLKEGVIANYTIKPL